ncbi:hypothetical protein [Frigoribacterium sp. MEB024]|uniref:hypothetical protein n=1 Tax=Frigoribacterium sp. MEB024 TaxID=1589899 RepID=UPI0005BE1CA3|nr:hypothetical protein [Frigoribacterium sp. MEB024]KIU02192.1 hypothetical protein SZ60_13325 [Frigoribacterium sp. MEB024]
MEELWWWLLFLLLLSAFFWYVLSVVFFLALGLVSRRSDASLTERILGFARSARRDDATPHWQLDHRWSSVQHQGRAMSVAKRAHARFALPLVLVAFLVLLLSLGQMMAMVEIAQSEAVPPAAWSIALFFSGLALAFFTLWMEARRWEQRTTPSWRVLDVGTRMMAMRRADEVGAAGLRPLAVRLQTIVVQTLLERTNALEQLDWATRLSAPAAEWIAGGTDDVLEDEFLLERWVGDATDLVALVVPAPVSMAVDNGVAIHPIAGALREIEMTRLHRERPTHLVGLLSVWSLAAASAFGIVAVLQEFGDSAQVIGGLAAGLDDDFVDVLTSMGSVAAFVTALIALIKALVRRAHRG